MMMMMMMIRMMMIAYEENVLCIFDKFPNKIGNKFIDFYSSYLSVL